MFDYLIRETEPQHPHFVEMILFKQLHNRASKTAHQIVIFSGDDRSVRARKCEDQFRIKWLHEARVDHCHVDAFQSQSLSRFDAVAYFRADPQVATSEPSRRISALPISRA